MKNRGHHVPFNISIALAVILTALPVHAQLVNDGATQILSNVTNTITGSVTVGTNGAFTLLRLTENSLLTNSGNGSIGLNATARSNEVNVTGSTARWQLGGSLFVGNSGSSSRLVIDEGAVVENLGASLGFDHGSSNNSVLVANPGTVWSNRSNIHVGQSGRGNQMVISNGAWVYARSAFLGSQLGATNNLVIVTGSGSVWTNQLDLEIGYGDASNRLIVADGGQVLCETGRVGTESLLFPRGLRHEIILAGPGSLWSNRSAVTIRGVSRLMISNGAALLSGGAASLGHISGGNTAILTGAGSQWGTRDDFTIGEANNRLELNAGASLTSSNTIIGIGFNGFGNLVSLSDPGTLWANSGNISLGEAGDGNSLIVSNGAAVSANGITIGKAGMNNLATVTGTGTIWSSAGYLIAGVSNSGNRLLIKDGAVVNTGGDVTIGGEVGARGNSVTVTGPGSRWSVAGDQMYVGSNGAFSQLVITNGARLESLVATLGYYTGSGSNVAIVTGPGSIWTNTHLLVGLQGEGNRLVVSNGGKVYSEVGGVGFFINGRKNNEAVVTGAGSLWSNQDRTRIGSIDGEARLVISDGAIVSAGTEIHVGSISGSFIFTSSNRLTVNGGSLLATNFMRNGTLRLHTGTNVMNAGLIEVDRLWMTNIQGYFEFNGGTLLTRGAFISNGLPFVVGAGGNIPAVWDVRSGATNCTVANNLILGDNTAPNWIFVTNGASLVVRSNLVVGWNALAKYNALVVAGAGSHLQAALNGDIIIGSNSAFNRLVISNRALVECRVADIGFAVGGNTNEAIVTGLGSVWRSSLNTIAGRNGAGNRLVINDGGLVDCASGVLGLNAGGSNSTVRVTGVNSIWSNRNDCLVGNLAPGNGLVVSNAGQVRVANRLFVGFEPSSTGNRLVVDGGTLASANLLEVRRGTNVLNAGWIETDTLRMTNGTHCKFEFNGGTLSIRNSRVSIGNPLIVGDGVSPATLVLAGNGLHDFTGTLGLIVTNNATLTGNGTVLAQVQIRSGALLSPGTSIGKISLNPPPLLSGGAVVMQLSKSGATLTNDELQVTGTLTYGGSLNVTHLGPAALAAGDRFQLFKASAYAGAFTSVTLPPLLPPLSWKNNLLVDGSIEVSAPPAIALSSGSYTQRFDSLSSSGGSNPWKDNATLVGWYAAKSALPSNITTYVASDGSDNAGALYSFGSTASSERALGSIASDSVGIISYGLSFTNDTGGSISNLTITYTGERWRGATFVNTLTFWYRVSDFALTNPEPNSVTNWVEVPDLSFSSPSLHASNALDGNQATNRNFFASIPVPGLSVSPGQTVFFRWRDLNDSSADQGLAVDDVIVSVSAAAPHLLSLAVDQFSGSAQIFGQGDSNVVYGIEAATNLLMPIFWERIGSNVSDHTGLFQFIDTNATSHSKRFYRAVSP